MQWESSTLDEKKVRAGFWKNRRVFITGITGFVGSWLADRLVRAGANVTGLVKNGTLRGSHLIHLGLDRRVSLVSGCLEDLPLLCRAIKRKRISVVYHLGAQPIVATANRYPVPTFKTNIEGTWNLLEACRSNPHIRAVVVASSDKAYGSHKKLPYKENFPLNAEYPYDVSKACADLIARSYFKTYHLPAVVTRFANLYGPGDLNFSRIVPDTIRSILQGKPPLLRSDGTPERDYLYIDDAVDLYLLLAERINITQGQTFNAGHNRPVSVRKVVRTLLRLAGREDLQPQILAKGNLHGEIDRQWLDGGKAKRLFGWQPAVPLEEGLRRTLIWYRLYLTPS